MMVFGRVAAALLSALFTLIALDRAIAFWDDRTLTDTTFTDRQRALARSEDVAFVDLLSVLRARRNEGLYFPRDGH